MKVFNTYAVNRQSAVRNVQQRKKTQNFKGFKNKLTKDVVAKNANGNAKTLWKNILKIGEKHGHNPDVDVLVQSHPEKPNVIQAVINYSKKVQKRRANNAFDKDVVTTTFSSSGSIFESNVDLLVKEKKSVL